MNTSMTTTPDAALEAVRTIMGAGVSPRPSEILAFFDQELETAIKSADNVLRVNLRFATTDSEIAACRKEWQDTIDAARARHSNAVESLRQWEASGQRLHALHETRDEAGEARNAARAMAGGEGGQG